MLQVSGFAHGSISDRTFVRNKLELAGRGYRGSLQYTCHAIPCKLARGTWRCHHRHAALSRAGNAALSLTGPLWHICCSNQHNASEPSEPNHLYEISSRLSYSVLLPRAVPDLKIQFSSILHVYSPRRCARGCSGACSEMMYATHGISINLFCL